MLQAPGHPTAVTFSLLLEYGDLDLDEYFALDDVPATISQIADFWQHLSQIGNAIVAIHNFTRLRAGEVQEYIG